MCDHALTMVKFMPSLVDIIVGRFGTPGKPSADPVPAQLVRSWMRSDDLEALGAVAAYISDISYSSRIRPSLPHGEVRDFILSYLERCIRENPKGKWASSPHIAAFDAARLFRSLWKQEPPPSTELLRLKSWFADLVRSDDRDVRDAVVNGGLEHLFEDPSIAEFFLDWRLDPVLASAYIDSLRWSQE